MKTEYKTWIEENVSDTYGTCREVTERMAEAFPELRRVRGHYFCFLWGRRQHWWLEDEDGNIIDPTAHQFPSKGYGDYEKWDESKLEPTGICPNCGDLCYSGHTCCSEVCSNAYARYCTGN